LRIQPGADSEHISHGEVDHLSSDGCRPQINRNSQTALSNSGQARVIRKYIHAPSAAFQHKLPFGPSLARKPPSVGNLIWFECRRVLVRDW
jgi:hypothetical protein